MNAPDMVSIGRIAGTYGHRGLVKIKPLTDFPERFNLLKKVKVDNKGSIKEMVVESCSPYRDYFIMKMAGIDDLETAADYRNALLMVGEDEVYPLPEGVFYHFQLQGLDVIDRQLGQLGRLTDILETGANDVYVVESDRFGEILIPAIKEVVREVDLDHRRMQVVLLPGLIDERHLK